MKELIERLEYAIARIEDHRDRDGDVRLDDEFIRLSGKIQGLKLALAYALEASRV